LNMPVMKFIPKAEFDRVNAGVDDRIERLTLFATMCRLNTLVEVKKAGSGHLGSSFSAMDINVLLYQEILNVKTVGLASADRDIFFSSKGHDVPGLYAVFYAMGILPEDKLLNLRRLGGVDGHPDVHIPGAEANTGSLGMGISKGRGMEFAKKSFGRKGRVFVMTGDGELQEGQIWESMQTAAHHRSNITVIVDHNKLQTDLPVKEIVDLGDLERKFAAFGWEVARCDGHDFAVLLETLGELAKTRDRPKILIADTIKGKGVSFMEKIIDLTPQQGKYLWHSGAPQDEAFQSGFEELLGKINSSLSRLGLAGVALREIIQEVPPKLAITKHYVAAGYGEELLELAVDHPEIVVLDGDLSMDCKIRGFENNHPGRFVENGIAEQDMVSTAGGMARQGLLPICNSFSSFLCARANEQIYNNACEGTKVIYAAHFAGMVPAGPGKSHQSVRDIGLLGSINNLVIFQPSSPEEARRGLRWAVKSADQNVMLRMNIGPSPRELPLPKDYEVKPGVGFALADCKEALIFAYGPVMLHEALAASGICGQVGISIGVVNMPWLNRFDAAWLEAVLADCQRAYSIDDHMLDGGFGERILAFIAERGILAGRPFRRFGLDVLPACGTPIEVLRHHKLDGESIAAAILCDFGLAGPVPGKSGREVFNTLEAAQ